MSKHTNKSHGGQKTMTASKPKWIGWIVVGLIGVAAGVVVVKSRSPSSPSPVASTPTPAAIETKLEASQALAKPVLSNL